MSESDVEALCSASLIGDTNGVKELLTEQIVNIDKCNSSGKTPLWNASMMGHMEIVNLLLQESANPNVVCADGSTALHASSEADHPNVVSLLLTFGCDTSLKCKREVKNELEDAEKLTEDTNEVVMVTAREVAGEKCKEVWKLFDEGGRASLESNYRVFSFKSPNLDKNAGSQQIVESKVNELQDTNLSSALRYHLDKILDGVLDIYLRDNAKKAIFLKEIFLASQEDNQILQNEEQIDRLKDITKWCGNQIQNVIDIEKPMILLQSKIRAWNVKDNMSLISIYTNAWNAIMDNQRLFIKKLETIINSYKMPLEKKLQHGQSNKPSESQIKKLFRPVDSLLKESRRLLESLEKHYKYFPIIFGVGHTFLKAKMDVYNKYLQDLPSILDIWAELTSDQSVSGFLIAAQANSPFPDLPLAVLLRQPVDHLSSFHDLILALICELIGVGVILNPNFKVIGLKNFTRMTYTKKDIKSSLKNSSEPTKRKVPKPKKLLTKHKTKHDPCNDTDEEVIMDLVSRTKSKQKVKNESKSSPNLLNEKSIINNNKSEEFTKLCKLVNESNSQLVAETLKGSKFDLNADCDEAKKLKLIHVACSKGNLDIVKSLLRHNARIDPVDDQKWTPLHNASYEGHYDIVNYLVKNGHPPNSKNVNKNTCLHYLVRQKNIDKLMKSIEILIKAGANVNERNEFNETPLQVAVAHTGPIELCKFLLKKGASLEPLDKTKPDTPLTYAITRGRRDLVELFEFFKAAEDEKRSITFQFSPHEKKSILITDPTKTLKSELEKICSNRGVILDDYVIVDANNLEIPLNVPLGDVKGDVLFSPKKAKENKADIKIQLFTVHFPKGEKKTILFNPESSLLKSLEKICQLRGIQLDNFQVLDTNGKVIASDTLLGQIPNQEAFLVSNQSESDRQNIEEDTNNNSNNIYVFSTPRKTPGKKKQTKLNLTPEPPNDSTIEGLFKAISEGNLSNVVNILKNCSFDINQILSQDSALHVACKTGNLPMVKALIKSNANIEVTTEQKWTPLHTASYQGNFDIILYLVRRGCDVNARNIDGNTCLHYLVRREMGEKLQKCLDVIIKNGAKLTSTNNFNETPLHTAISRGGSPDVVRFLVKRGSSLDAKNINGMTPLQQAISIGKQSLVDELKFANQTSFDSKDLFYLDENSEGEEEVEENDESTISDQFTIIENVNDEKVIMEIKTLWVAAKNIQKREISLKTMLAGKSVLSSFGDQLIKEALGSSYTENIIQRGKIQIKKKEKKRVYQYFLFEAFLILASSSTASQPSSSLPKLPAPTKKLKAKHIIDFKTTSLSDLENKNDQVSYKLSYTDSNLPKANNGTKIILDATSDIELYNNINNLLQKNSSKLFGVPLATIIQRRDTEDGIPFFLKETTCFIKKHGVVEGIFRLSGSASKITEAKELAETKGVAEWLEKENDPHVVANLLKLLFRDLPEPIFPFYLYPSILETATKLDGDPDIVEVAKPLLKSLPKHHYHILHFLMLFLLEMSSYSPITKMDSSNLSTVFATNLMRPKEENFDDTLKFGQLISFFSNMIKKVHELFQEDKKDDLGEDWQEGLKSFMLDKSKIKTVKKKNKNKTGSNK